MTHSIAARQRWAESHFLRKSILSKLFEELGMASKEDVVSELKPNQMKRNCTDLNKIICTIQESLNPFSEQIPKDQLYNIGSGKAASSDTSEFLLNVGSIGSELRETFIGECIEDSTRFERRIQKRKIFTFATEGQKYKLRGKDDKIVEVRMERDLFGSILFLALQRKIDMGEVLKYPLTPVPLSLCHIDGTMQKTQKSTLMTEIEKRTIMTDPMSVNVTIIDGLFFLYLLQEPPSTFGLISKYILRRVCEIGTVRIDLVFDRIMTPSIKDYESRTRAHGQDYSECYEISGPAQKRPKDFNVALRNKNFKKSLIKFLIDSWQEDFAVEIIKDKIILVTCEEKCFSYRAINSRILKTEGKHMQSTHEEADSRMIFHIMSTPPGSSVVIRTIDTDVLMIILGNMSKIDSSLRIWMEVGQYTKNNLRYINVNQLHNYYGTSICEAVPSFHAFNECDYTSSFSRKGKVRPFKLLQKNKDAQKLFAQLGKEDRIKAIWIQNFRFFPSCF